MNGLLFFSPQWTVGRLTPCGLGCFGVAGVFCNAKGQRETKITLAFLASHEACRRMAVYAMQAAGSRTMPASREACRRAAVKPRLTGFPPSSPAPIGRGVGCRVSPCQTREPRGLSPSGGNSAANLLSHERPCAPAARSP